MSIISLYVTPISTRHLQTGGINNGNKQNQA